MNCQEFWNNLPEAEGTALADHEHVVQCPACAARMRGQAAIKHGLRALAGQMSRTEAPPRVEARLRAAFRAHNGMEAAPARHWRPAFAWAAALAALLVVALVLVRGRAPQAPPPVSHAVELADNGIENGFIPLPNAAQIDPAEEVNVVRVEVPRSAMIALGYDVKPEEASQSVEADVMLGTDGLARAVRFLD